MTGWIYLELLLCFTTHMTLSMVALTPEGIVLTADSRQSYPNALGTVRIGTENANKLFKIGKKAGVVIAGTAFAVDDKGEFKSISWFIQEFSKTIIKKQTQLQ